MLNDDCNNNIIEVVDYAQWKSSNNVFTPDVVSRVKRALELNGVFIIRNPPLPKLATSIPTEEVLDISCRYPIPSFFHNNSPETLKKLIPNRFPVPRGYSGVSTENFGILAGNTKAPNDLVEKFRIGPPTSATQDKDYYQNDRRAKTFFCRNIWPEENSNGAAAFRLQMEALYEEMQNFSLQVLSLFEACLELPAGFLSEKNTHPTSILSANHYPPLSQEEELRMAEHTDVSLFTLLSNFDQNSGLQVKVADDRWVSVPYYRDSVIVNLGDAMEYWTRGTFKSCLHRVAASPASSSNSSRYSIGYFAGANYNAPLHDLSTCKCTLQCYCARLLLVKDYSTSHKDCPCLATVEKGHDPPVTYFEWRKARVRKIISIAAAKK